MGGRTRSEGADNPPASRETPAFDRWLHKQLHALYDPIAREPLPDELIALIERDAVRRAGTQQPGLPE
jgi:hypothetical protein